MSTARESDKGFFAFFREYTHTGIHAASTAGLTAFGLLTFVHRAFVILAIGVYVLPPIYLYLTRDGDAVETVDSPASSDPAGSDGSDATDSSGSAANANGPVNSPEPTRTEEPTAGSPGSPGSTETAERPDAGGTVAAGPPTDDGPQASTNEGGDGTTEPTVASEGSERAADRASGSRADVEKPEVAPTSDTTAGTGERDRNEQAETGVADEDADATAGTDPGPTEPASVARIDDVDESETGGTDAEEPAAADEPTTLEWTEVDSPTDETLFDVVAADSSAYAVGTDGVVLARADADGWETVLEHGPSAESNALRGVDAADDGRAVWFTGDSGALGHHDIETGRHTNHSAPEGITDNWVDVAVAGAAGEERVHLVNGSGQVLSGEFDGSEVEWAEPIKPGSGSSMSSIEFVDETTGYCCDTNSGVYETTDGEEFDRIGIEGGGAFTAIAAAGPEALAVADSDGTVQRYDGSVWTPLHAAEVALDALSTDDSTWLAVGDGGTMRELADGSWEPRETPVETNLHGVAVGEPSAAVGAEGTIIELQPAED